MKADRRKILKNAFLLLLPFTFTAAAFTFQFHLATRDAGVPVEILQHFFIQLEIWLPWAILTPFIFKAVKRIREAGGRWYVQAAGHLAVAVVSLAAQAVLYHFIGLGLALHVNARPPLSILNVSLKIYDMRILSDGIILGIRLARERALAAAELKAQLAQAQLGALKTQIHPHFLFNTLNTVSALVHEDPDAADRTIGRLSELLRLTLENSGRQEVPLQEEIDVLGIYLDILETRFGERIKFRFEIESIPPRRRFRVSSLNRSSKTRFATGLPLAEKGEP
jgi:hypothetical protein